MSKLKSWLSGILVCLACVALGVLYGYALYVPKWRFYAIAIPVVLAFYTLVIIGFWIGIEMIRSASIEEDMEELEELEEKNKRKKKSKKKE